MDMVPKMTTVDTAMAVLCPSHFTTGSAPSTAAAPQMALPVAVIREVSLSIFISLPSQMPRKIVPATMMVSITTAGSPTAATCVSVRRNP